MKKNLKLEHRQRNKQMERKFPCTFSLACSDFCSEWEEMFSSKGHPRFSNGTNLLEIFWTIWLSKWNIRLSFFLSLSRQDLDRGFATIKKPLWHQGTCLIMPRKTSFMVTVIIVHPGHMANLWTGKHITWLQLLRRTWGHHLWCLCGVFLGRKLHLLFPLAQDIALETKVSVLTSFNV